MLKQRVATASIMFVVFAAVLFLANATIFAACIALVVLVGAWEWSNLSGVSNALARIAYVVLVAVVLSASYWWVQVSGVDALRTLLLVSCTWWAVTLLWVQGYPASSVIWQSCWVRQLMGLLVLVPAWHALVYLHEMPFGEWVVLTLVLLVASADTGAYFTGKAIGKHKLAPKVSPGKTWEGVVGGSVFAVTILMVITYVSSSVPIYWAVALALPTAFVSVLGDLFESMLKRHRGIKDSSNLLPGHGGVLDRLDGLVAAAPVFALALLMADWSQLG